MMRVGKEILKERSIKRNNETDFQKKTAEEKDRKLALKLHTVISFIKSWYFWF